MAPSAHLLRTLAAVAPGARIVEVGCGDGRHTDPLVRLGFDVWASDSDAASVRASRARLADALGEDEAARRVAVMAPDALGYPDATADWGVVSALPTDPAARVAVLQEVARVLAPGAWVWVETAASAGLTESAEAAGLVVAEEPAGEGDVVHAIFRRPSEWR